MNIFKLIILSFIALLLSISPAWCGQPPQVVVSINPLHSLTAGIMQGVAEPLLLVKGGSSPHSYVLRPSEASALSTAELVIWGGRQLETFLEKPLATLADKALKLELTERLAAELLPFREIGNWDGHDHTEHGEHGESEKEDLRELNPHFWLDPGLAGKAADEITIALIQIDPGNQQQYRHNARQLKDRLDNLDQQLRSALAEFAAVPYVVFHDAYQYFEKAYGLNAVGSISTDPERKPGARRLQQLRKKIKRLKARAVFSEPQFEPRLVATIIEGTEARSGVLDPLGVELPAGPDSYFLLMRALAENLRQGLRP